MLERNRQTDKEVSSMLLLEWLLKNSVQVQMQVNKWVKDTMAKGKVHSSRKGLQKSENIILLETLRAHFRPKSAYSGV